MQCAKLHYSFLNAISVAPEIPTLILNKADPLNVKSVVMFNLTCFTGHLRYREAKHSLHSPSKFIYGKILTIREKSFRDHRTREADSSLALPAS